MASLILFAVFAGSFAVFAVNRLILVLLGDDNENTTYVYLVRLVAFALILVAIADKNDRNNTLDATLESYGLFGEVYFDINDRLKFTGGLRYNNDKKTVQARSTLANFLNGLNDPNTVASIDVLSNDNQNHRIIEIALTNQVTVAMVAAITSCRRGGCVMILFSAVDGMVGSRRLR